MAPCVAVGVEKRTRLVDRPYAKLSFPLVGAAHLDVGAMCLLRTSLAVRNRQSAHQTLEIADI